MRSTTSSSYFARFLSSAAALAIAIFAFSFSVNAQTTTFAQFFERVGGNDFVFTNNTSSATFNTVGGGSPIFFIYSNITGLDPSLQGIQSAHLFVSTTTTVPATLAGTVITQPLSNAVTVQIIRDTPAPVGVGSGSRTNLLTAVFAPSVSTPGITGSDGSATLQAATPSNVVTFTSDFLGFGLTTGRNLSFSFSSVTPNLSIDPNGFVANFVTAGSGTFASNPPPIYLIPSAAPVSFSGRLLTAGGYGLRNAQVLLTEANGTVHQVTSSSFGYFNFPSIESGQNVVISVRSKQFQFTPQVVSLNDSVTGFEMTAQ